MNDKSSRRGWLKPTLAVAGALTAGIGVYVEYSRLQVEAFQTELQKREIEIKAEVARREQASQSRKDLLEFFKVELLSPNVDARTVRLVQRLFPDQPDLVLGLTDAETTKTTPAPVKTRRWMPQPEQVKRTIWVGECAATNATVAVCGEANKDARSGLRSTPS